MGEATRQVWVIAEPLVAALGAELVDVELLGKRRRPLLRLTIDSPEGVSLELCADVSDLVGSALIDSDPVPGSYTLEVTSPGLERKLKTTRQWQRSVGETVRAKLKPDGQVVLGELVEADEDGIVIEVGEGQRVEAGYGQIASGRTVFEWDGTGG